MSIVKKRQPESVSEDDDEHDCEMDDFIDDEGEQDMESVSGAIRKIFSYDKRK